MSRKPVKVLLLIIILAFVAAMFSLPENYNFRFSVGQFKIDEIINPPSINIDLLGFKISKEIKTHLGLDLAGGTHIALEAEMDDIKESDRLNALESAKQVIERRVNFFGVSEPIVQSAKSAQSYRIIVELPGITNTDEAISLIGQTAMLELREFIDEANATDGAMIFPSLLNTKSTGISGKDLKKAELAYSTQTGQPEVSLEFTSEGGKKFSDITSRLVGKVLPIFLDQMLLTWPRVDNPISDGRAVIQGQFTRDEAKTLALQLNAGALPVPVKIVEKRTVGATLGQQSIDTSIKAGALGLSIVAVYMILQYGFLGFLADLALILYGLLTFALFRFIPITLTLPGIAGFFLSVGMAVDANILIFERYKEEKRRGKPQSIAMELGFGKAWDSIRDANFTTILTALILYNPGNWSFLPVSGLVRGFAATLLIGVLISLFTGIVVSRTLIRVFYKPKKQLLKI